MADHSVFLAYVQDRPVLQGAFHIEMDDVGANFLLVVEMSLAASIELGALIDEVVCMKLVRSESRRPDLEAALASYQAYQEERAYLKKKNNCLTIATQTWLLVYK